MTKTSACWLILALASTGMAQTPTAPVSLTLEQAEAQAIKNHPLLQAAQLNAGAAAQDTRVQQSSYWPTAAANLTGAVAENNTRLGAGALNNPTVYDRYANGVTVSQLVTDFGRTGNLVKSAQLRAAAANSDTQTTRAEILLQTLTAYLGSLRAQALLQVAQQTVDARQTVADQVTELAKNQLRSGLDVSFANVNLAQAKLDLAQAQTNLDAAYAELAQAMGLPGPESFALAPLPAPGTPPDNFDTALAAAMAQRPELAAQRLEAESDARYARAEADLKLPTVSAIGSAGLIPWGESPLPSRYAAAGANVSIPIFNGNQFSALQQAAELRAKAASQQLREIQDSIGRDVRVAWLQARTDYQRLDLTQQLLTQATDALDLAQSRYNLGLGSIVELSQAQLNLTQAQTENTDAVYRYQISLGELQFQTGALK